MVKTQSFLLILISAFLIILVYVTSHITNYGPVNMFENRAVTVLVTGDIMLGRSVMTQSLKKNDPTYPFLKVANRLKKADLVFGNLEAPFVEDCPSSDSGLRFCADPQMVKGLSFANIGIVGIANNHIANYGQEGIADTKRILTEAKIDYAGLGSLATKQVGGMKFGFLAFDFVTGRPANLDYQMVVDSKKLVDILIVGVHWGEEYKAKANQFQRDTAKRLVESGADVVAGHHPHWVQDEELINGKPVYYSLGNFVFDQPWSTETKRGLAIELTFKDKALIKEEKLPLKIETLGQPEWVSE